jgi:hypothetical protein
VKKRKAYRPRPVIQNPLALMRPASPEKRERVMAVFWSALQDVTAGTQPGPDAWRDLSDAINTVETLAMHLGKLDPAEVMPDVQAAIESMVAAAKRHHAGLPMRMDGRGLAALRAVLDVYDQCLEGLTEREMAQAQAETQRRVNAIARNPKPSHHVVSI